MSFLPAELIKKKRDGRELSEGELAFLVEGYTAGKIPEYQMSAFLMAVFFRGMNEPETLAFTKLMLNSGTVVDLSHIPVFKVDKHSTGGVGDKTSLILGPIVAACGVAVPMISGRGLGHTGGTLDKLESIPGFNVRLTLPQFIDAIRDHHICFIGQTAEICPADRKMYSLRDVTATVESLPLICASILSKKLAEGIDGLVLDVKFGSGAFMKTAADAEKLALLLMNVARKYGKKVSAFLTDMNQPLGRFAGNSLEVAECVEIMKNIRHPLTEDTRRLSLELSAEMLLLAGKKPTFAECLLEAEKTLTSGLALKKFEELCGIHSGRLAELPSCHGRLTVAATRDGFIGGFNTEAIGYAAIEIKAGRLKTDDLLDLTSGIEFHKKIGDTVAVGETLFTIHCDDMNAANRAHVRLSSSVDYSLQKAKPADLILKKLSEGMSGNGFR